jgi:hypothetical protein
MVESDDWGLELEPVYALCSARVGYSVVKYASDDGGRNRKADHMTVSLKMTSVAAAANPSSILAHFTPNDYT